MRIQLLPERLRDIRDDGRSIGELVATLQADDIAIFQSNLFLTNPEPIPPQGTLYDFRGIVVKSVPMSIRSSAAKVYQAVSEQCPELAKPSLRSSLFLMERMSQTRLFADVFMMNQPVFDPSSKTDVYVTLGREDEDGMSWVAAVGTDYSFEFDTQVIALLRQSA